MRFVVLAVLVASCGGGPQPAAPVMVASAIEKLALLPADERGLRPGERATYVMTVAGVELGEAAFAVGQPGELDGAPAIVIASRADATGLVSFVRELGAEGESTLDAATGYPIRAKGVLRWGDKEFRGELAYNGSAVDGGWYEPDGSLVEAVYRDTLGPPVHNVYSAMSAVRAWSGEPGERRELWLHGAVEIWRTELTWVGREMISVGAGNVAAVRIDGRCLLGANHKWAIDLQIWVSDDADRVPLRMSVRVWRFSTTFELTGYERAS